MVYYVTSLIAEVGWWWGCVLIKDHEIRLIFVWLNLWIQLRLGLSGRRRIRFITNVNTRVVKQINSFGSNGVRCPGFLIHVQQDVPCVIGNICIIHIVNLKKRLHFCFREENIVIIDNVLWLDFLILIVSLKQFYKSDILWLLIWLWYCIVLSFILLQSELLQHESLICTLLQGGLRRWPSSWFFSWQLNDNVTIICICYFIRVKDSGFLLNSFHLISCDSGFVLHYFYSCFSSIDFNIFYIVLILLDHCLLCS